MSVQMSEKMKGKYYQCSLILLNLFPKSFRSIRCHASSMRTHPGLDEEKGIDSSCRKQQERTPGSVDTKN